MFRNYLKVILRTMMQNKLGYFLNISGLAIGIAAFIFIFYYVGHELKYDDFHENKGRIYRVALSQYENGELISESAENYPGVGPALEDNMPEVLAFTRLYNAGSKNNVVFSRAEESGRQGYKVNRFFYADTSFFRIFSFPLLEGDRNTCLSAANRAVISESFARKVFGGADPMGKMIRMSDDDYNVETCQVTGVFKDVPFYSHLKFDVLISYANLLNRGSQAQERYGLSWRQKDMYTYILVKEGTDPGALEAKFPKLIDQFSPELVMLNRKDELHLQPLSSIHLDSHLADEAEKNGQRHNLYTLILAGLLILIVAMANFLNYAVARSIARAKGFGIRKIFGAVKQDVYLQFIFEAVFLNLLAVIGALAIVALCFPYFKNLTETENTPLSAFFFNSTMLFAILSGIGAGIIFGGFLPAIILNRFDLTAVVKGKLLGFGKGLALRRGLITFQIAASMILTIICLLVLNQVNFLIGFDLGIDVSNTYVLDRPGAGSKDIQEERDKFLLFKTKLLSDPAIQSVTGSSLIPGERIRWRSSVKNYGQDSKSAHQVDLAAVDESFLSTLGLGLLAGRPFSRERRMDADTNVVISDKAARALGYQDPAEAIGKTITLEDMDWSPVVIGVVEDYHQLSLKENTHPTVFMYTINMAEYYLVKVNAAKDAEALAHIKNTWNTTFPGNPFHYYYLQDFFNAQYSAEQIFARYMLIFAVIAILISGIGLFNISLFTMVQRTTEIGVRKTLGASTFQIGWLLVKDYLILIAAGSLIAAPAAYLFGREWLANFVYNVPLSIWYFIIALLTVLSISILTISFYTIRATRIDPVKAIKNIN